MMFYPFRKTIGIVGFLDLALGLILTYQYITTHLIAYAICAVAAVGLAVFILVPVFRNQVVEIINDSIIVDTFGERNYLTIEHLTEIRQKKDGTKSYRFSKQGSRFQVTPYGYSDKEAMADEFVRIFDKPSRRN